MCVLINMFTSFRFMWQMCGYLQTTLDVGSDSDSEENDSIALLAAKLTTSFVLETFIHAKEKPTMLQWIELLTKQFNSCQAACEVRKIVKNKCASTLGRVC